MSLCFSLSVFLPSIQRFPFSFILFSYPSLSVGSTPWLFQPGLPSTPPLCWLGHFREKQKLICTSKAFSRNRFHCSFASHAACFNLRRRNLMVHTTGLWSLSQSAPEYVFAFWTEFLNLWLMGDIICLISCSVSWMLQCPHTSLMAFEPGVHYHFIDSFAPVSQSFASLFGHSWPISSWYLLNFFTSYFCSKIAHHNNDVLWLTLSFCFIESLIEQFYFIVTVICC